LAGYALSSAGLAKRILLFAAAGVSFAALLLTRSAGGFTALASGLTIFFLLVFKNKKRAALYAFLAWAALLFTVFLLRPDIFSFPAAENSLSGRFSYWQDALSEIFSSPYSALLGFGPGAYSRIGSFGVKYPHNMYLQFALEYGLAGLAALVFLAFVITKETFYTLKNSVKQGERAVIAGLFSGTAAFFVHGFIDIDSNYFQNTAVFAAVAGALAATWRRSCTVSFPPARVKNIMKKIKENGLLAIIGTLLLVSCVFAKYHTANFTIVYALVSAAVIYALFKNKEFLLASMLKPAAAWFYGLALLALCFTPNLHASIYELIRMLCAALLFFLGIAAFKNEKRLEVFLKMLNALSAAVAAAGIIGYLFIGQERSSAFFPNPNLLAGFLAVNIAFCLPNA
ncbi:MAG: O-antigen ligase family protein, partial [Candidatus Firestonebacteria bacterium]